MAGISINPISILIGIIVLYSLAKGISNRFSPGAMFIAVRNDINNVLFAASLITSVYLTREIFIKTDNNVFRMIFNIIPENISSYLESTGILIYVYVTPLLLIMIFLVLEFLRSLFDIALLIGTDFLSNTARRTGRLVRALIGILLEIPKMAANTITVILIISILNACYPAGPLANASYGSRAYNTIYSYTVVPVINSHLGQEIPAFLWSSIGEVSSVGGNSLISNGASKLQTIGYIRFQYETKSNPAIDEAAKKIVGNESDDRRKEYKLYKWIGNNIGYDWNKYSNITDDGVDAEDKFGAIPAFESRKGVCEDYSDLYVAMAKAVGLKVRVIVGQGFSNGSWGGHAWNEVYIPAENKWIPLDTTWAKSGNYFDNKDFTHDHIFEAVAGEW